MAEPLNIALVGGGTVGGGVTKLLLEHPDRDPFFQPRGVREVSTEPADPGPLAGHFRPLPQDEQAGRGRGENCRPLLGPVHDLARQDRGIALLIDNRSVVPRKLGRQIHELRIERWPDDLSELRRIGSFNELVGGPRRHVFVRHQE